MTIQSAQYTQDGAITASIDGKTVTIPDNMANRHRMAIAEWEAEGNEIAPASTPSPTASDVRAEASRRMQIFLGARDSSHLEILISNGTREAVRLMRMGEAQWTPEEADRAAELAALDDGIEAIRAASNAMEADPPADFADDSHWPAPGV